jgi:hypothetical protein
MDYLTPVTETSPRPGLDDHAGKLLYIRSYLVMRTVIGFVGILLPFAAVLIDYFVLSGDVLPRDSVSAYYHSGVRDIFVGSLCVIALFLITYKVFEHNLDNTLSLIAGVAALGVAVFPSWRPAGTPLTPLQDLLGEQLVATIHFVCAAVFIGSLAIISYYFGEREGKRGQQRDGHRATLPPTFWRRFHKSCALIIALAVVFIAVTKWTGWFDDYSVLIGEAVAALSFGASWLMKGLELDVLLGPDVAKRLQVG